MPYHPRKNTVPPSRDAGNLLGRDFIAAVVVFHELVGRALGLSATDRKCLDLLSRGPVTAGEIAAFTGLTTGAVTGIKLVAAILPALGLFLAAAITWNYPIDRKRLAEIQAELAEREASRTA